MRVLRDDDVGVGEAETDAGSPTRWFSFHPDPATYRHLRYELRDRVAVVELAIDEEAPFVPGYRLKRRSYDLGVDIELADLTERLRLEHPEVAAVVLTGGADGVFCAGANIGMLASSSHPFKVNFCRFTNETRNAIEDAARYSGQPWISELAGAASGGGYELALATERILLVDDGNAAVSLPEVALLGVLPGTGGLTRLVDKRCVRPDLADVFATRVEGIKGATARDWGLVDEVVPRRQLRHRVEEVAAELVARSHRPPTGPGLELPALEPRRGVGMLELPWVRASWGEASRVATVVLSGPDRAPATLAELIAEGGDSWAVACARQFDEILLELRFGALEVGTLVLRSEGSAAVLAEVDQLLHAARGHWLTEEILGLWRRVLRRLDATPRSLFALLEPNSCWAGPLAEVPLAADRSYLLDARGAGLGEGAIWLGMTSDGVARTDAGLTRLERRFRGDAAAVAEAKAAIGRAVGADEAAALGLVTFVVDELDWEDELRLALEERAGISPDALTGMEANLRAGGPETVATKTFGRLSAWQNWVFARENATGPGGALRRYGTGERPAFDWRRT